MDEEKGAHNANDVAPPEGQIDRRGFFKDLGVGAAFGAWFGAHNDARRKQARGQQQPDIETVCEVGVGAVAGMSAIHTLGIVMRSGLKAEEGAKDDAPHQQREDGRQENGPENEGQSR